MSDLKRKAGPPGRDSNGAKRKKAGNQGKWQTPHQKQMLNQRQAVETGDAGIWVTCARSQESKAAREAEALFEEYAQKLYNIKPAGEDVADNDEEEDIEASIQKELKGMKPSSAERPEKAFTVLRQPVDCLFFVKTKAPIEPVEFVHRICLDAQKAMDLKERRCRYLNRFTPITVVGRASEKGVAEVCEQVLPAWFKMRQEPEAAVAADDKAEGSAAEESKNGEDGQGKPAHSYAIRLTTRNKCPLKRDDVIKQIASMIDDQHKVNLSSPDKVILVDMFQNIYGMSVVDGDWDDLKRYNIAELYGQAGKKTSTDEAAEDPKA